MREHKEQEKRIEHFSEQYRTKTFKILIIIEKITKRKTSDKLETIINYAGFVLMIILMIYVTFNDIVRLVKSVVK